MVATSASPRPDCLPYQISHGATGADGVTAGVCACTAEPKSNRPATTAPNFMTRIMSRAPSGEQPLAHFLDGLMELVESGGVAGHREVVRLAIPDLHAQRLLHE